MRASLLVALLIIAATDAAADPDPAADPVTVPAPDPYADWTPLDDDGWPRGVSLEEMRSLRPCHYQEQLPGPGEVIPCRPAVLAEQPQWALHLDWTTGIAAARDAEVTGGAQALGVQLDFGLGRHYQLGARYELMGLGTAPDDIAASHRLFAQARRRLFTDEVGREAFVVTLGGGVALQDETLGGTAPIARLALAREVGMYLDDENAITMGLELAYEQSVDDTQLAALLLSARIGFEVNIPEPGNLGTRAPPPSAHHWSDGEVWAGPALGLAFSHGYALGRHLALTGTASYLFGRTEVTKQHGLDEGAQWAVQAGPRVNTGWPSLVPVYGQLQAGPAWIAEAEGRQVRAMADAELGLQLNLTCGVGVDLGFRLRADVMDEVDVTTGMIVLRLALGGGIDPGRAASCGRGDVRVTMPTKPVPPPVIEEAVVVAPPPPVGGTIEGGGSIEVEVEPPPPPEPIVIEVELGAVIAGGLVQIQVDPRILPLDRLRGTGAVDIELSGPRAVLLEYERKLRKHLDGVDVAAWASVATSGSVVRAKFTVWPPGSR